MYLIGSYQPSLALLDSAQHLVKPVLPLEQPSYLLVLSNAILAVEEVQSSNLIVIDKTSLTLKQKLGTAGASACHISANVKADLVVVTNYSSSNFSVFAKTEGGNYQLRRTIVHTGKGPNEQRQECSHPHSSTFVKDSDFFFVADLGNDSIYLYQQSVQQTTLIKKKTFPGRGPRTLRLEDDYLYVSAQLSSTILVLSLQLDLLFEIPSTFQPVQVNYPSQIYTIDGLLFVANRSDDSVTIFKRTAQTLQPSRRIKTQAWPRHFFIDKFNILVACQKAGVIQTFDWRSLQLLDAVQCKQASCIAKL